MTPQELLEKIKTISGEQLFKLMKAARLNSPSVFKACYDRAKELKEPVSSWIEAKKEFDSMMFPSMPKYEGQTTKNIKIKGYVCQLVQVVDKTLNITEQYMTLINCKTNACVVKRVVEKGEVAFT